MMGCDLIWIDVRWCDGMWFDMMGCDVVFELKDRVWEDPRRLRCEREAKEIREKGKREDRSNSKMNKWKGWKRNIGESREGHEGTKEVYNMLSIVQQESAVPVTE